MKTRFRPPPMRAQRGATLIEVLVSLVILMVGLLGLVGVMIQSQRAQLESYQRVQALLLVQDMAARLNANKTVAECYVTATWIGTGQTTVPASAACGVGTTAEKDRVVSDMTEWRDLLLGSAEKDAGGSSVGSVLGARGCITRNASDLYQVSVAWQGTFLASAPPGGVTCAANQFGSEDLRRAVSVTVQLGDLT
jgi:type IV pilus assembly protein PilV